MHVTYHGMMKLREMRKELQAESAERFPQVVHTELLVLHDVCKQLELNIFQGQLRQMGGLENLPYEVKRQILLRIVDEITLNTKECWFEIRGVLRNIGDKFCYDTDRQVVSTSGCKRCQ